MANTYLSGDNSRGKETAAMNGTYAHFRGWDAGVRVTSSGEGKGNVFQVYMTPGSGYYGQDILLGEVTETPSGPRWTPEVKEES